MLSKITDVKLEEIKKYKYFNTHYLDINWIYSGSIEDMGLPVGSISLWAGMGGVGKSRLVINLLQTFTRYPVLYITLERSKKEVIPYINECFEEFKNIYNYKEIDNETIRGLFKKDYICKENFYISESSDIEDIKEDIFKSEAKVVVIDSINMLEGYKGTSDNSIKDYIIKLREICNITKCHIILVSQLTKKGDPRGSNVLPHMVDTVVDVTYVGKNEDGFFVTDKQDQSIEGYFAVRIGEKNRFGRTGIRYYSIFRHSKTIVYNESNQIFKEIYINLDVKTDIEKVIEKTINKNFIVEVYNINNTIDVMKNFDNEQVKRILSGNNSEEAQEIRQKRGILEIPIFKPSPVIQRDFSQFILK